MVCMLYKCCKTKQLIACIFEYQVPYPCQVLNTSTRILQRFITSFISAVYLANVFWKSCNLSMCKYYIIHSVESTFPSGAE